MISDLAVELRHDDGADVAREILEIVESLVDIAGVERDRLGDDVRRIENLSTGEVDE